MTPEGADQGREVAPRRSSVLAHDVLMSQTAGALFLLGGMVNVALLAESVGSSAAPIVLAMVSTAIGARLLAPRRQLTPRHLHVLLAFATLLIAAEAVAASDPFAAVLLATLAVLVSVAAFFFSWPQLAGHLTFVAICTITAMALHPGVPWPTGVAITGFVIVLTVINKLFLQMAVVAEFDEVTGLPNRRGIDRHIASWVARAQAPGDRAALILISTERSASDSAADSESALLAILDAWSPLLGAVEKLGRRDPDQIAVFYPHATAKVALALVERLRAAAPAECDAGLTTWRDGDSAALLITRAEAALFRAKLSGDRRTVIEVDDSASEARRLRRALQQRELAINYQPIVELSAGHPLVAVEALLRWPNRPRPAMLPPEMVHIAEEGGLADVLDDYILRTACVDALAMQRLLGDTKLMLNVNISAMNLIDPDFADRIGAALAETTWSATQLTLEVTEMMLDLRGGTATSTLQRLRESGIRIAVDDFGTGYSSLSRLQELPVDRLKLDKSITDTISPSCDEPPALLRAVAALAVALDLPVTVEGVETRRQMELVTSVGFDQAQGFIFGAARGVEAFTEAIELGVYWWEPDASTSSSGPSPLAKDPVVNAPAVRTRDVRSSRPGTSS